MLPLDFETLYVSLQVAHVYRVDQTDYLSSNMQV